MKKKILTISQAHGDKSAGRAHNAGCTFTHER